ncbi:tryptophan 2,3-dioxygenase family protein [Lewinella sp. W8]|uniref:tryptophan 2,3-dioxygenase family protein n=1 Tax=Lewinella sp. W8 TaxID=2528208 RepID=UPI0010678D57|nr:tryptophan 2,3-dioxygenase family protein [Lewinella sp. W8]MTB50864.1 tryptophan 2,3-dioxygenase [Lewinella sp. W8]
MEKKTAPEGLGYGEYLHLDKLLNIQHMKSEELKAPAHDEMLFIVIHQAYELWFKQIIYELNSVTEIFSSGSIDDNSGDMGVAVHRLKRIVEILRLLVDQVTVLETMTPIDFLDFRDMLVPASGFQSYQFRYIEALLGLKMENRHAKHYYRSQLKEEQIDHLEKLESQETLLDLVETWLSRFPFFDEGYWKDYTPIHPGNTFWEDYQQAYADSLSDLEGRTAKMAEFQQEFLEDADQPKTTMVNKATLFIMLYRDFPLLQQPFLLIDTLIEIDQLLASWRHRHMTMVRRMIGMRMGTGGTSGKGYLHGAANQNYIFNRFAGLATFLIERRKQPSLPKYLKAQLSYLNRER